MKSPDYSSSVPKLRVVPKEGWIAIVVVAIGVALEIALYIGLIAAGRAWLRARRQRKLERPHQGRRS